MAFTACAWLVSRQLGALVTGSTALAGLTFYVLLPYSKPAGHPELTFQLDYFLRAWLVGPWQGLALLCLVIAAVLLGRRQSIPSTSWPALLLPGLFSLLFAGMITLSRAGFGLEQANSSRYFSHSLMLGLTALITLAVADDRSSSKNIPLLGSFLVLISTLMSFPQGLVSGGLSYSAAWIQGRVWADQKRQDFACHAQQAALAASNVQLIEPCKEVFPQRELVDSYFQGIGPVLPLGWHQDLWQTSASTKHADILQHLDQITVNTTSFEIQGWAFVRNRPSQQLYVLGDYGAPAQLAVPIRQSRRDVKRAHKLPTKNVGFNAALPRTHDGHPLRAVSIGTPNQSVQI